MAAPTNEELDEAIGEAIVDGANVKSREVNPAGWRVEKQNIGELLRAQNELKRQRSRAASARMNIH